jgi:hypothetical protein
LKDTFGDAVGSAVCPGVDVIAMVTVSFVIDEKTECSFPAFTPTKLKNGMTTGVIPLPVSDSETLLVEFVSAPPLIETVKVAEVPAGRNAETSLNRNSVLPSEITSCEGMEPLDGYDNTKSITCEAAASLGKLPLALKTPSPTVKEAISPDFVGGTNIVVTVRLPPRMFGSLVDRELGDGGIDLLSAGVGAEKLSISLACAWSEHPNKIE